MNHHLHPTLLGFQAMLEADCWPSNVGAWVTFIGGFAVFFFYLWFAVEVARLSTARARPGEWRFWWSLIIVFVVCGSSYALDGIGVWWVPTQDLMAVQHVLCAACTMGLVWGIRKARPSLLDLHSSQDITDAAAGVEHAPAKLVDLVERVSGSWAHRALAGGTVGLVQADASHIIRRVAGGGALPEWADGTHTIEDNPQLMAIWEQSLHGPVSYTTTWEGVTYIGTARPWHDAVGSVIGVTYEYIVVQSEEATGATHAQ